MTLREASMRFGISLEKLNEYESLGLIVPETCSGGTPDYAEQELCKLGTIHALLTAGMQTGELRSYLQLLRKTVVNKDEQIRMLRKQRFALLGEIHTKQQSLDALDYMIETVKKQEV